MKNSMVLIGFEGPHKVVLSNIGRNTVWMEIIGEDNEPIDHIPLDTTELMLAIAAMIKDTKDTHIGLW